MTCGSYIFNDLSKYSNIMQHICLPTTLDHPAHVNKVYCTDWNAHNIEELWSDQSPVALVIQERKHIVSNTN